MISKELSIVYSAMDKMQLEDIREVLTHAETVVEEKEKRFAELVTQFYEALDALQTEFTQAYIPLQISPDEMIDAMNYMIPQNYHEKANIGA